MGCDRHRTDARADLYLLARDDRPVRATPATVTHRHHPGRRLDAASTPGRARRGADPLLAPRRAPPAAPTDATGPATTTWSTATPSTPRAPAARSTVTATPRPPSTASTACAGAQAAVAGPNVFTEEPGSTRPPPPAARSSASATRRPGTSSNYDRHIYMDNAGHLIFGVYNNGVHTLTSPKTYNDGQWHQVVGTLSAAGMALYVDGKQIGANGGTTVGPAVHRLLAGRRRQPQRLAEPAAQQLLRRQHRRGRDLPDRADAAPGADALHRQRRHARRSAGADRRLRQGRLQRRPGPLLAAGRARARPRPTPRAYRRQRHLHGGVTLRQRRAR